MLRWVRLNTDDGDLEGRRLLSPALFALQRHDLFVVAVPTPYSAVTKADGSFKIADVPDGSYTVKVWHPKLKPASKPVTVAGATEAAFEIAK